MKVRIRRIDASLPLPQYHSDGAAALDCSVRVTTTIEARQIGYVPLNIALKPPKDHFVLLVARSSLHKKGIHLANGVGIMDEDFSGNNDEYKAVVHNFTDQSVTIERGDRIVQIAFLPYTKIEWEEVDDLGVPDRGGFGTTGK